MASNNPLQVALNEQKKAVVAAIGGAAGAMLTVFVAGGKWYVAVLSGVVAGAAAYTGAFSATNEPG